MRNFVLRLIVNGIAIALVAQLLPGINIIDSSVSTLAVLAIVFGLVNAIIRPVIMFLSCPFIILSLGILIPIINGLLLMLTASIAGDRMTVDGLGWAILGGILMGITVLVLEAALGLNKDKEKERKRKQGRR